MSEELTTNKTLRYYNANAENFITNTQFINFKETQQRFLQLLPAHACILDFGCGSGRDTKYFLDRGYQVEATDGAAEICKLASEYTGIAVRQMLFEELDAVKRYDGIWACSSILHLPKAELLSVMGKMKNALRDRGIIYTSFKYGEFEGERNGRYFTDFTKDSFAVFMKQAGGLRIEDDWITGDVRPGRGYEMWLNLILRRE